jgi:hypothetical protein
LIFRKECSLKTDRRLLTADLDIEKRLVKQPSVFCAPVGNLSCGDSGPAAAVLFFGSRVSGKAWKGRIRLLGSKMKMIASISGEGFIGRSGESV